MPLLQILIIYSRDRCKIEFMRCLYSLVIGIIVSINVITQFVSGKGNASIDYILRISFPRIYWSLNTLGFEIMFSRIFLKLCSLYSFISFILRLKNINKKIDTFVSCRMEYNLICYIYIYSSSSLFCDLFILFCVPSLK